MSQVATKKRLSIRNEKIQVNGHFHEQGSVLKGDAEGFCDGFEITISLDSEEDPQKIQELIRLARQMCFTEKALANNTPVRVKQILNGQDQDF
ncbi:MAG: OsmC family protein [Chloroflexi bacterium]|nr:OsmC family protein [Chloroflexota bacterium]